MENSNIGQKQVITETRSTTKTESIALYTMMVIGMGGILAMLMSTGSAVARGCAGGSEIPQIRITVEDDPNLNSAALGGAESIVGVVNIQARNTSATIDSLDFDIIPSELGIQGGREEVSLLSVYTPVNGVEQLLGSTNIAPIPADCSDYSLEEFETCFGQPAVGVCEKYNFDQDGNNIIGITDLVGLKQKLEECSAAITVDTPNLSLAQGQSKILYVKVTTNPIDNSSPAEAGAGFTTKILKSIQYTPTTPGEVVTITGFRTEKFIKLSTKYVYKSSLTVNHTVPMGTATPINLYNKIQDDTIPVDLMTFDITAQSQGPIGLYKFTFEIETNGVALNANTLTLYESDSAGSLGDIIAKGGDIVSTGSLHEVYFDVNDNNPNSPGKENRIINAGSRKYFTLQAYITGHDGIVDNESITTSLKTDTVFPGSIQMNANEVDQTSTNNFIWSDLHLSQYSTSSAVNAAMFYNGYRVIPERTQTIHDEEPVQLATLDVGASFFPAAQSVVAGSQNFNSANFIFDTQRSDVDVTVHSISLVQKNSGNSAPSMFPNMQLYDNGVPLNVTTSIECGGSLCSDVGTSATTTFHLGTSYITIPARSSKTIALHHDISSGATSGEFNFEISGYGITAINDNANSIEVTTTENNQSKVMTLVAGGRLNVSLFPEPLPALVVGGTTVEVGKFTLGALYEDININSLGFTINPPDGGIKGGSDEVNALSLFDGVTNIGTIYINSNHATITPQFLQIGKDGEKTFVLKATFNQIADISPAIPGAGLRVELSNIDAEGVSPGSTGVQTFGLGMPFNTFSVFKSLPNISQISFNGANTIISSSTEMDLFKFSVNANTAGPIGLFKFTFEVDSPTNQLSSQGFRLYESDSLGSLGDIISNNDLLFLPINNGYLLDVYFDVNNDNPQRPAYEHRIINSGVTKYYTLRGSVLNSDGLQNGNETIITKMYIDPDFPGNTQMNAFDVDSTQNNNFIWSDLHLPVYASSTAVNAKMFYNGYRVTGIGYISTPQVITD